LFIIYGMTQNSLILGPPAYNKYNLSLDHYHWEIINLDVSIEEYF